MLLFRHAVDLHKAVLSQIAVKMGYKLLLQNAYSQNSTPNQRIAETFGADNPLSTTKFVLVANQYVCS